MAGLMTTRRMAEAFDNGMEFFATFGASGFRCQCQTLRWRGSPGNHNPSLRPTAADRGRAPPD